MITIRFQFEDHNKLATGLMALAAVFDLLAVGQFHITVRWH